MHLISTYLPFKNSYRLPFYTCDTFRIFSKFYGVHFSNIENIVVGFRATYNLEMIDWYLCYVNKINKKCELDFTHKFLKISFSISSTSEFHAKVCENFLHIKNRREIRLVQCDKNDNGSSWKIFFENSHSLNSSLIFLIYTKISYNQSLDNVNVERTSLLLVSLSEFLLNSFISSRVFKSHLLIDQMLCRQFRCCIVVCLYHIYKHIFCHGVCRMCIP